ncbi:hypothetical protein L1049_017102 [Liquidambar formosana]|uniref:Fatty acyl-CoA reductase n=1 Tax=Liquidambar formosana TaxID=63359 RepID=A0AAP0S179_LIQFO
MSSFQSSVFIAMKIPAKLSHTHRNHDGCCINYGSFLRKVKNRINIFCCQNDETMRAYGGFSSNNSTQPERTKQALPLKNVVVDGRATTPTATATATATVVESSSGIGVVKFHQGRSYFITGATGFVAKVLIEKLLRTVPNVGKIFVLIKAKNKEAALDRLKNEVIDSELFECLKQVMLGKSYEAFMLSKLIPVVGNVCESNLGMDANTTREIAKEVDVLINSAANTTFDERYDVLLNTNTRGPCQLSSFAKKCNRLSLFLHVSTAYVSGDREGVIMEKPFYIGESIAEKRVTSENHTSYQKLDVHTEIKLALDLGRSFQDNVGDEKKKELGLERAISYGWRNTYELSKAMGEMLISSKRGEIAWPVVFVRPSIIQSTYKEPFPGWIQGYRMGDPLIFSYGKGHLPGFPGNPAAVLDIIPLDMVVNAMIAAMAKHGIAGKPDMNVYHVASSIANPLMLQDFFKFQYEYFRSSPLMDSKGKRIDITEMRFSSSMDDFSSYIGKEILQQSGLTDVTVSDEKLSQLEDSVGNAKR